jgi:Cadherin-like domain
LQLHTNTAVASHKIANGFVTFDSVPNETFTAAVPLTSTGDVAAAVQYLQANNLGTAGATVAFTATVAGLIHTYVFIQGDAAGTNNLDELIDLPNVQAAGITAAANQISLHVTPVASNDTLSGTEDTPITYSAAQLLGNDTDALSIASVTSGTGGIVVLNVDGSVTFTPGANFNGPASFSYIATEGLINSNSAAVTVNVAAVNDAPVAMTPWRPPRTPPSPIPLPSCWAMTPMWMARPCPSPVSPVVRGAPWCAMPTAV